jgi:hypothetical protein
MSRDITCGCDNFGVLVTEDDFAMLLANVGYWSEFPQIAENLVVSTTPS